MEDVLRLFKTGKGNGQNKAWDLFNGYTEWIDWERTSNDQKREVSAVLGQGSKLKQKAFETVLSL